MKKILVLSYYFQPCTHPGAVRANTWAKYLHEFGYYPIFVTRNWERPFQKVEDVFHPSGQEIIHEKKEKYEVYYLPYQPNLRERLYLKWRQHPLLKFIYFVVFFLEGLFEKWSNAASPYQHLYDFTDIFLQKNKEIASLVVTAAPFQLFKWGHDLHKKHALPWLADYQDDWTTNELIQKGFFKNILNRYNQVFEKKWLKNAAAFTAVTPLYKQRIEQLLHKKGELLYLGYDPALYNKKVAPTNHFNIVFNGRLYPEQDLSIFWEGFKKFIDQNPTAPIQVQFWGLAYEVSQSKRVKDMMEGYDQYVLISERIPHDLLVEKLLQAQAFLLPSYGNLKGILPTKLYEYLACKKAVLLCPSDEDIMENILEASQLAYICKDSQATFDHLDFLYQRWLKNPAIQQEVDENIVLQYSNYEQCRNLAKLLDKYL